jgi:hypothetical protein
MFTTRDVRSFLKRSNPGIAVTEDRIRHALRRGNVAPGSFAGRLAWSRADVVALAAALNLAPPALDDERGCVAANG